MIHTTSSRRGRAVIAAGLLSLAFMSCATLRANNLLVVQTTDNEKAELLFADGLERYTNDLLKKNDLTRINAVRTRFKDALALDPDHPRAAKYLVEVDAFREKQYAYWLASAKSLSGIEKRTANQDYELVLAVKKLNDLVSFDKEVSELSKSTKDLRKLTIKDMENRVKESHALMKSDTGEASRLKNIKNAEFLALNLQKIDPRNGAARRAVKDAKRLLDELPPPAAAAAPAPAASKTPAAKAKTPSPAKAKKTSPEAEKPKARDYDAEIASILTAVDERINKNDPAGAREVINSYLPLLAKQSSKNKLSAKGDAIKTMAERLYNEGIDLYNQEDYEGAQVNFSAVVRWDSKYKDAREYLDRSNAKIRALSGR